MSSRFVAMTFVVCVISGCAGAQSIERLPVNGEASAEHLEASRSELASLAEMERRGQFAPGLGLYESGLRERSGDRSGAVFAAYKELADG